ncbi:site-specific integrase [Micromonospora aurantiaca (nom. illeg.)]|uniref:hypothetical protein n=1 Tax=Micromonospora aurantiaca (nom. illeg.) TaxID=47850 RepID=UPI00165754E1|nr:hypothetical protein [Micromonospora aurantiaca]MBC9005075.1 hypothetical protein [Micromonospora aurantiaca]
MNVLYVAKTVKDTAAEAGQPPEVVGTLAGHSLRAGFATAAEATGVARDVISRILGHHTGVTFATSGIPPTALPNRPCTSMHSRFCGLAETAANMEAEAAFAWTNRNVSEAHTLVCDVRTDLRPACMCTSDTFSIPNGDAARSGRYANGVAERHCAGLRLYAGPQLRDVAEHGG